MPACYRSRSSSGTCRIWDNCGAVWISDKIESMMSRRFLVRIRARLEPWRHHTSLDLFCRWRTRAPITRSKLLYDALDNRSPAVERPHPAKSGLGWAILQDLCWPRPPGTSTPEIIAHDQAENEPGGADRALQRTADLRFTDTRVVADRDFNHAISSQRAFQDHLNRPAVGRLFESEGA